MSPRSALRWIKGPGPPGTCITGQVAAIFWAWTAPGFRLTQAFAGKLAVIVVLGCSAGKEANAA